MKQENKTAKETCRGRTHGKRYPYHDSKCLNKAGVDGYCKIHSPTIKRVKQAARDARRDEAYASAIARKSAQEPRTYTPEQVEQERRRAFEAGWMDDEDLAHYDKQAILEAATEAYKTWAAKHPL